MHEPSFRNVLILTTLLSTSPCAWAADDLYVDGSKGGTLEKALAQLPARIDRDVTIHIKGNLAGPKGEGESLGLSRPMREGRRVRIIGEGDTSILSWTAGDEPLVLVTQGRWSLENLQIGTRQKGQRRGVRVTGPGVVELHDVRIRTASQSAPGLHATRSGLAELFGKIELNEDLHEKAEGETFTGIEADYGGVVRFREREKASLSIGNGSLSRVLRRHRTGLRRGTGHVVARAGQRDRRQQLRARGFSQHQGDPRRPQPAQHDDRPRARRPRPGRRRADHPSRLRQRQRHRPPEGEHVLLQ
jgi:hypothetical protein